MKVIRENSGELVLREDNLSRFIGSILLAAICGGFAYDILPSGEGPPWLVIACAFLFAIGIWSLLNTKIITISLSKTGMCRLSAWSLLSRQVREIPASSIKGIRLDRFRGSGGYRYQYSVVFLLGSGSEFPFEFGRVYPSDTKIINCNQQHGKKIDEARKISGFLGVPFSEGNKRRQS